MNNKVRDLIFFLVCTSLIFPNLPKPMQMNFLGGPIGNKLTFYPLVLGIIYTFWCEWKYKNILVNRKIFLKFLCIYGSITFLSLIIGLILYPFFSDILNGPVAQIEKLPKVLHFLQNVGINIKVEILLLLWMIIRIIKTFFLEILYSYLCSYLLYCWYRTDWQTAFKLVTGAVMCSICIIFLYSFFLEVPYLMGNVRCTKILEIINPYIHPIRIDGKWWPPLLWNGQLRSVFAEPSYFGIYTAFAVPFLWYLVYKNRIIIGALLTFLLAFLLFLTKARTGFMLLLGEIVLLLLFFIIFERNRDFLKKTSSVVLCILLSFVGSNLFMSTFINKKSNTTEVNVTTTMTEYIDSNATSLANPDKRSNRARYSIMEADFRIGLDHPILGVGRGLRNGYIPQYLPEKGKQNGEVKMWLDFREKLGIFRSGFPMLGEYTVRFGETGIIGLSEFLAPVLFLIFSMVEKIICKNFQYKLEYGMFLISLFGIIASGIGDNLNITYCCWVLLGLGYAMCFGKASSEKDVNERT